jgi:peptidyl-prolyl cis-trans isomerase B (cyclophilin B)
MLRHPVIPVSVFLVACLLAAPVRVLAADQEPAIQLEMISPSAQAGHDVRLKITLDFEESRAFTPAMLDAACFRIDLGTGEPLVPRKEGLKKTPVDLGGAVTVSRVVNVGPLLQVEGCKTVRAWWQYKDLASAKISFGVFEWPLDQVEALIETELGTMVAEFYPDKAPRTVANFVKLSADGFYDGLIFHRVMPGFMIQGGCPNGDGTGDPGYSIPAEFNDTSHARGVLSMARGTSPDSAGCQFFVMHADVPGLDWQYTAFGSLVSGYEVLDKIAALETTVNPYDASEQSRPLKPPRIESITIRVKEAESKDRSGH